MRLMNHARGWALAAAACVVLAAAPAAATDGPTTYDAKDGNGTHQTFFAWLVGSVLHPGHLMMGLFAGAPTAAHMTHTGALDVLTLGQDGATPASPSNPLPSYCVVFSGSLCGGGPQQTVNSVPGGVVFVADGLTGALGTVNDFRPASSTITATDAATTTTTGQGAVSLVAGTPTANSFQTQAVNAKSSAAITVTGTFVGTLNLEASYNGGTTYVPVSGLLRGTSLTTAQITGPSVVSLDVTGVTNLRARASAWTSGTATVQMAFSNAAGMTKVLNGVKLTDANGSDVALLDLRKVDQTISASTANAAVTQALDGSIAMVCVRIDGLTASAATLTPETTTNAAAASPTWATAKTVTQLTTLTADGDYCWRVSGKTSFRLRNSATGTGTITLSLSASGAPESPPVGMSNGVLVPIPVADLTPFLNMSTATTTKMITASAGKRTLITLWAYQAAGTTNHKLVSGTGTNCGTGTAALTETEILAASNSPSGYGDGSGIVIAVAAGLDTCAVSSAAVGLTVHLAATQAP